MGVTRYCVVPAEGVVDLPKVGGTKKANLDAIRALAPDLIVANQEENDRRQVETLIAEGWPVVVTLPGTVDEGIESIELLGRLTGRDEEARRVAGGIRSRLERLGPPPVPGRRVFCPIWKDPWMTANDQTFVHDVLARAGGENVFAREAARYPTVDPERIRASGPEVVLLPDEPWAFSDEDARRLRAEVLPELPAERFHRIDGQLLSWYGPRMADGVERFRRLLQP